MLRHQNLLEEDGIEDLHFYFVSFNNHKTRVLYNQEIKAKRRAESQAAKGKASMGDNN